jgi:hypothetical protein
MGEDELSWVARLWLTDPAEKPSPGPMISGSASQKVLALHEYRHRDCFLECQACKGQQASHPVSELED